ncbi:MAG: hypothetical protein EOM19_00270 [Candidatus Moranbacteria bacterium]|nr:hypothetical protein [Candidatus Moranbacteria bacterium]
MSVDIIGMILEAIGTICIAIAALSVNRQFLREHRVDGKVLRTMRYEQIIGIVGIFFVLGGFFLQIMVKV